LDESLEGQSIETDQQRLEQIIKNLLSNAFKFTSEGSVTFALERSTITVSPQGTPIEPQPAVAFVVEDTGIGMTPDQQKIIFEGFQQADGSTSRKYGGTGLGLTISRELVHRLGGLIEVESRLGQGSTFVVYLPLKSVVVQGKGGNIGHTAVSIPPLSSSSAAAITINDNQPTSRILPTPPPPPLPSTPRPTFTDDRDSLDTQHKRLLIVEDDSRFARIVYDYARKKGFQCLVANDGAQGLEMARAQNPDAIILDLRLPLMSGWQVLEQLKGDPRTRHIPIHIVSVDDQDMLAYKMGAMGFLSKPLSTEALEEIFQKIANVITRPIKTLLIVEDDVSSQQSIQTLLSGEDVKILTATAGQEALQLLHTTPCDCIILDLTLPDMSGFDLLSHIKADENLAHCPVIIYTGRDLTEDENIALQRYADSVIIKGVKSPERLLDETALFLHRIVADLPAEKRRTIQQLHGRESILTNKHILVVDDDMRNAFALSKLLGDRGMSVSLASNGQKALDILQEDTSIDLVLMDIMMPEMDGYETMRRIRTQLQLTDLPILALTAKAMKGDAEKCVAAGANDYLSKPVDADRLFSMLRVWLYR
jgi:CheY-like chemotaxis protein